MIITRSAATDKNDSNTSWNDDFVLDNCNDYEGNDVKGSTDNYDMDNNYDFIGW